MNAMSTANPRTFLSTTSVTVTILVFTSLFNGVVTQTPGVRPITDPRPKSYFHILNNAVGKAKNSHLLQNSSFAGTLRKSILDFHRLGYENVVANFMDGIYPTEDKNQTIGRSQNSVYTDMLLTLRNLTGESFNKNDSNISSQCIVDFARVLIGIVDRDQWAIPFLDSTGKPGPSLTELRLNFVGNYKQCRDSKAPPIPMMELAGFQGNYCVLKAIPRVAEEKAGDLFSLKMGLCVPSSCSSQDLTTLVAGALGSANLDNVLDLKPVDCHTDEREFTKATVMAIFALTIIGILMLVGTAYDAMVIQGSNWTYRVLGREPTKSEAMRHVVGDQGPLLPPGSGMTSQGQDVMVRVILAFSVYTNGRKLLDTKQAPGSLSAIYGLRFFSMTWIILGHVYVLGLGNIGNILDLTTYAKRWTFDVIMNAFPSVDTFFTIGGLLTGYLTLKYMNSKETWKIQWSKFYFHRLWRLTPPYMLVLLMTLGLQRFLGSGALWNTVQPHDKEFCEKNWWTNLLYVNNIVKYEEACFGHSWYLACDMQFYILSPLLLIPFHFHYLAGIASCAVFLFATWMTTGVLSTQNHWLVARISENATDRDDWFYDYYIAPWNRMGPYIVGMTAGYLLAITEGGKQLRMKWWMVVLGWTLATASGLAVVYGIDGDISGHHPSSLGAAALYNAVSRSVWGACVCWVIVACASGYGGPVNTILSWSPFVFLGKLTYMVYLFHPLVIFIYYQNMESLHYIDDTNVAISFIGVTCVSYMAAFVLMLALESPWVGLEKIMFTRD